MALIKHTYARLAGDTLFVGVEPQPPVDRTTAEDLARVIGLDVKFHTLEEDGGSREVVVASRPLGWYDEDSMAKLGMFASRLGVAASRAEGRTDEVFDTVRDDTLVAFVDAQYGSGPHMGEIRRKTEPGDRGLYLDPHLNTGSEHQYLLNCDLISAGLGHLVARTIYTGAAGGW